MESSVESNLKLAQTSDLLKTEQQALQQEVKQCRFLCITVPLTLTRAGSYRQFSSDFIWAKSLVLNLGNLGLIRLVC
jgi:hypothetical protein